MVLPFSGTFGQLRAKPEAARKRPKGPEAARNCPNAFEVARNCSEQFRAGPTLQNAALDVSCWAFGPLLA
eukprot:8954900-Alexandrium_andersonii.AAC.1